MKRVVVLILSLLFLSRGLSLAWSAPGHMTIAAIAYRDLSPEERTNVDHILIFHPEYASWRKQYPTNSEVDLGLFIFMHASTWPDQIRGSGSPYDHPLWHYVDFPLEPTNFPDLGSPFPTNDILYGISQSEKMLKDPNVSPELHAVYLSWLIHLLGDIHQPLHCETYVTPDYPAPVGDKGGNAFFVRPDAASDGMNLHSIWDHGLGAIIDPGLQYTNAIRITAMYPRDSLLELSKDKTPLSWSKESRAIAIESGYLNGTLPGSLNPDDAPVLPEGYLDNLKAIASKRAALAGYRLSDEINRLVKSS